MNEDYYVMWLLRVPGVGNGKAAHLIELLGSAENVWKATTKDLSGISWLKSDTVAALLSSKKEDELQGYIKELNEKDIQFVSIYNNQYPKLLREIEGAPQGLYIKGKLPGDNFINISIIGSRNCTDYGLTVAYKLSKDLASNGFAVVSGMATGIDSKAHEAAVDANGHTIAVLGCGVDVCYPAKNWGLMQLILEKGCLISEYPPGTKAAPGNFPVRNRIISGISRGLVVVEASERSGTNITVDQALEQGREIFAVPGSIFNKQSVGVHRLIKDGACLVTCFQDILVGLGIDNPNIIKEELNDNIHTQEKETLDREEKILYDCIGIEPITFEELMTKSGLDVPQIQYYTTTLVLKKYITQHAGQRYVRVF